MRLLLLPVMALVSSCGGGDEPTGPRPSVLLLSIDTLRADVLGCYGKENARTPNLDSLAQTGVLFENAMCQAPATGPSFASLMTSKYPEACGVLHSTMPLRDGEHTLAEEFQQKGYRTGAFISCGILQSKYGFRQGFDAFDEAFLNRELEAERVERDAAETTAALTDWLRNEPGKPFFAWVHYFDSHAPYRRRATPGLDEQLGTMESLTGLERMKSEELLGTHLPAIKALYQDEVSYVDEQVGKVLETLKEIGGRDNTLIVLAADHGEELFDHHFFHGHFMSLSESVIRTPLIFSFPKKLPEARRIAGLVENLDIFPTTMAVLGYLPPAGLQGQNLLPAMKGEAEVPLRYGFAMREPFAEFPGTNSYAVRMGVWKLVFFRTAPNELYNLEADPMEKENLAAAEPDRLAQFEKVFGDWRKNGAPGVAVDQKGLDPDDLATLKSLGYIR